MDKKIIKCSECEYPLVNPKGHYHRPAKDLGTLHATQIYFHV